MLEQRVEDAPIVAKERTRFRAVQERTVEEHEHHLDVVGQRELEQKLRSPHDTWRQTGHESLIIPCEALRRFLQHENSYGVAAIGY